jgi:hypothetical protein
MRVPNRQKILRREVTRVLLTPARGPRARATLVVVGRDLAFDSNDEWNGEAS